MPSVRIIRRRIRSVQSTTKITKAMEMIAASKMRRAQQKALAARPYAERMREVLADLAAQSAGEENLPALLTPHKEVKRIEMIHMTPDRGLCGGLNANLNRRASTFILGQSVPVTITSVGRKGRDFMIRYGREVRAEFTQIGDNPSILDVGPIARTVIDDYTSGYADQIYLSYADFVSTMVQRPVLQQLLPVEPAKIERIQLVGYIFEPNIPGVLEHLLPRFIEMQIYHALLEAIASEQSARMVAMRNATDNALEMIDSLTLMLNKARQEAITKELLDIVGGVAALEG